jgi:hypothetical protein
VQRTSWDVRACFNTDKLDFLMCSMNGIVSTPPSRRSWRHPACSQSPRIGWFIVVAESGIWSARTMLRSACSCARGGAGRTDLTLRDLMR